MEAPIPTSTSYSKIVEIEHEGRKYKCEFQIIEESIYVSIFLLNILKYKGYISLNKNKTQIIDISDCNIKDVFEELIKLDAHDFSITKESDKYILKIKFIIFNKEKNLIINLKENKDANLTNNDIISYYENIIKEKDNTISELKEIIKFKDEKIKSLEEQLKNKKKRNNKNRKS